jgi:hypothetical protein
MEEDTLNDGSHPTPPKETENEHENEDEHD